jgi:hypothetical protein
MHVQQTVIHSNPALSMYVQQTVIHSIPALSMYVQQTVIHSILALPYDKFAAFSKTSSPQSAI